MESSHTEGILRTIRVLDLADERAIYGSKLIADLGADVIRVERPEGDPLRLRGPFACDNEGEEHSLYYAYYGSNRRSVTIDLGNARGRETLRQLALSSDVVIDTGTLASADIDVFDLLEAKPEIVIVLVTSFGSSGPWAEYLTSDLVAGALGGFVATTGDVDTQPLKAYGELNFTTTGLYAAIGSLTALRHARETGEGQVVELAVHEAIPSCLEHVLMWGWFHNDLPMAKEDVLARRGSLHWSDMYEVMDASDGSIMITTTPDPMKQLAWLVEMGVEQDLLDPKYGDPEQHRMMVMRMMEVLRDWVAQQNVEDLFFEAQERHFPYGWVLSPERVAQSPQLEARDWWMNYQLGAHIVRGPGAPYLLEEKPIRKDSSVSEVGADTREVLKKIGWVEG